MKMASNSFLSWRRNGETDSDDSDIDIVEGSFIDKQKEGIIIDSSDVSDDSFVNRRKTRNLLEDSDSETHDKDEEEEYIDVKESPHKIIISEDNQLNSSQSTINESTSDNEGNNLYDENFKILESNSSVYKNNNHNILVNNSFENNNDHKYNSIEERSCDENENTSNLSSNILKSCCEIVNESSSLSDNHGTNSAITKMLLPTTENKNTSVNVSQTIDIESFKPECVKTSYAFPQLEPNDETNSVKSQLLATSNYNSENNIAQKSNEDVENLKAEKVRLECEIKSVNELIRNTTVTLNTINLNILPDKGVKLKVSLARQKRNLDELSEQLERVNNKLSSVSIDDNNSSNNHNIKVNLPKIGTLPSTNIHEMGKRALETYRVQQSLTIDSLRELHNSLKSCPSEDKIIPDPEGLKLSLMDHQKQALVWLLWREKEKPSGGILADDMGLGKTLTMLSLILKKENDCENRNGSSNSEEEDDNDIAKRNRYKGGTLVVCPASLIGQWESEIKRRVKQHFLTYEIYHGQSREKKPKRLAKHNIIITSYAIVRVEMGKSNKNLLNKDALGLLFQVNWKRIILDEAHNIKNHTSQTATAVFNLKAKYRWALTGTPIHNKTQDFFSLIKFLRCKPFDDIDVWKKWVEAKDETGSKRLNTLTKSLMLRRTKNVLMSEGKLVSLPEKQTMVISVCLNKDELSLYEKVSQFSKTLLYQLLYQKADKDQLLNQGIQVNRNYKNINFNEDNPFSKHPSLDKLYKRVTSMSNVKTHEILVLLLRLRQICCHPALMKSMIEKNGMIQDGIHDIDGSDIDLLEKMSSMNVNDNDEESESYESEGKNDVFNTNHQIFKPDWPSSKIQAILRLLEENLLETDDKIVIVSQWSSMLELLYNFIRKYKNCKCDLLTGKVPVDQRMNIVNEFNDNFSKLKILLLSLTAGGTGLNLVGANNLILTDLHWNPQLEAQACDRIYRVGQNKPVKIYKFICTETIEERIQELQQSKLALAEGVFSGSKQLQVTKLSLNDLKMLFNIA